MAITIRRNTQAQSIQQRVDQLAEMFFAVVATSRGINPDQVSALQGAVFCGQDAVTKGLANGIASPDLVNTMAAKARQGNPMTAEEKAEIDALKAKVAKLEAEKSAATDGEGEDSEDEEGDTDDSDEADDDATDDAGDSDDSDDTDDSDDDAPDSKPAPKAKALAKGAKPSAKAEIKALRAQVRTQELKALIGKAVKAGRVPPGKKGSWMALGERIGPKDLELFLATQAPHASIAPTKGGATGAVSTVLTREQKEVMKQLGVDASKANGTVPKGMRAA